MVSEPLNSDALGQSAVSESPQDTPNLLLQFGDTADLSSGRDFICPLDYGALPFCVSFALEPYTKRKIHFELVFISEYPFQAEETPG
jgi:hypothetical protein